MNFFMLDFLCTTSCPHDRINQLMLLNCSPISCTNSDQHLYSERYCKNKIKNPIWTLETTLKYWQIIFESYLLLYAVNYTLQRKLYNIEKKNTEKILEFCRCVETSRIINNGLYVLNHLTDAVTRTQKHKCTPVSLPLHDIP